MNIEAWIRQPSTLHGIGVIAAGVGVALAHLATGNPTIDAVAGVASYALVHLGIDDNSAAERATTRLVSDVIMHGTASTVAGDVVTLSGAAPAAFAPTPPGAAAASGLSSAP